MRTVLAIVGILAWLIVRVLESARKKHLPRDGEAFPSRLGKNPCIDANAKNPQKPAWTAEDLRYLPNGDIYIPDKEGSPPECASPFAERIFSYLPNGEICIDANAVNLPSAPLEPEMPPEEEPVSEEGFSLLEESALPEAAPPEAVEPAEPASPSASYFSARRPSYFSTQRESYFSRLKTGPEEPAPSGPDSQAEGDAQSVFVEKER